MPSSGFSLALFCFAFAANMGFANPKSATNRFQFRLPQPVIFRLEEEPSVSTAAKEEWLKARPERGSTNVVEFGSRVVVQLANPKALQRVIAGHDLSISRTAASD